MLNQCRTLRSPFGPAAVAAAARLDRRCSVQLHQAIIMTQRRQLKLPIPVTIITGALGVGKTTTICSLLQNKPPTEVWCIIVNEFGAVGIDSIAIEASCIDGSAVVKQIAGGCMCCVLSGPLSAAIAQIIRQVKPDRVIIEPSGLGHPGGLIDILQGPHLCTSLQLNAVICLVDLAVFDSAALMANPIAADQVTVADMLVGSKADVAAPTAVHAFQQWAADELFPLKQEVLITANGQLDCAWLDAPRASAAGQMLVKHNRRSSRARQQQATANMAPIPSQDSTALVSASTESAGSALGNPAGQRNADNSATAVAGATEAASITKPGYPARVPGFGVQAGSYCSCGWVFDQHDMFDQVVLLQLLQALQPHVARIKGVFRVGQKQWVMPLKTAVPAVQQQAQQDGSHPQQVVAKVVDIAEASVGQLQLQPVCYRGASMVEVIIAADSNIVLQTAGSQGDHCVPAALRCVIDSFLTGQQRPQEQGQQTPSRGESTLTSEPTRATTHEAEQIDDALKGLNVSTEMVSTSDSLWRLMEQALLACLLRR